MKNLATLLTLFVLLVTFTSCKTDQQKKAEIVTNNYVKYIDSVTKKGISNAIIDWNHIAKGFEKKSNELNIEIDKLENVKRFDDKINPATAKYEDFRNIVFEKKLQQEKNLSLQ